MTTPFDATARKFLRAAKQRFVAAEFLLRHAFNFEAVYLAGYVIECALKTLILERTPERRRTELVRDDFRGERGHRLEVLIALLRRRGVVIPPAIAESLARASGWSTALRYETGIVPSDDANLFLRSAAQVLEWVQRSI